MVSPQAPDLRPDARHGVAEGWCAVLVLGVVAFHVYQFCNTQHFLYAGTAAYTALNGLDGAIPALFVCTAFLVFHPLARAVVAGESTVPVRRQLARGATVLLPVYYVVVVMVWLVRQASLPGDWRDLLEHLTFTQVFDAHRIFYTIGPAWAVSTAVLSLVLLLALVDAVSRASRARRGTFRSRTALFAASAAVPALASLGWKAWSFGVGDHSPTGSFPTWFGPAAHLDDFAVGMLLALLVAVAANRRAPAPRAALRVVGLAVLVGTAVARQHSEWLLVYSSTLTSLGFATLLAADVLPAAANDRLTHMMGSRRMRALGAMSLSTFLWHEPLLLALRHLGPVRQEPGAFVADLVVVVAATVVVGWASYVAVQRPALRLAALSARVA